LKAEPGAVDAFPGGDGVAWQLQPGWPVLPAVCGLAATAGTAIVRRQRP